MKCGRKKHNYKFEIEEIQSLNNPKCFISVLFYFVQRNRNMGGVRQ